MEDKFLSIWDLKHQNDEQYHAKLFARVCAEALEAIHDFYPEGFTPKISIPVPRTTFAALTEMANGYGKSPDVIEFKECYFQV